jgi:hypothetical protein
MLKERFFSGRAIILAGARRTGKTFIANKILEEGSWDKQSLRINCDNPTDRELLSGKDLSWLKSVVGNAKVVYIDEGQKVANIGETLKLLVDHYGKEVQVLVTGSSSIQLLTLTQEPLTGRKWVFQMYPLSLEEMYGQHQVLERDKALEQLLVYGSYPEVASATGIGLKRDILLELTASYLYKDILEFQLVKSPDVLDRLLRSLALQVGMEVSYHELSKLLGIDKNTVERYVDLLEKSFIVFRLSPWFSNKRNENSKMRKVYFYDLGIRNALINNFNPLALRQDVGQLWENFLQVERLKYRSAHAIPANCYFWRTYNQAEVDLVEERDGKLFGFEFKWGGKLPKAPAAWGQIPDTEFKGINTNNLSGFVWPT